MKKQQQLARSNIRSAKRRWGSTLARSALEALRGYSEQFQFSVANGDLVLLDHGWYVTNAGLIRLARRNRCAGIDVKPVPGLCDAIGQRWAFEATVFKSRACRGFVGYGDADPSNVSPVVRGAEMRVAETRAVNRALRKAYGIGLCSIEEIGAFPRGSEPDQQPGKLPPQSTNRNGTGKGNGSPRVRDRLCQLIRQHQLDPDLVKAYAIDFCGVKTLKEANRAQVETFVDHLADWAAKDRDALLCQLNSYPRGTEKNEENAGAA